ncbi:unnamed protein product, partial [Discosporangium mesarthrocarpum]
SYNETLLADKAFLNPHATETMANAYRVSEPLSFLIDVTGDNKAWGEGGGGKGMGRGGKGETGERSGGGGEQEGDHSDHDDREGWFYDTVRDKQNRLWADKRVKKGVDLARKGQHQAAIEVYTQALGMCPGHEDGLVARGAAYASTGKLTQAKGDLTRALSLDPENANATRYLKETMRQV